MKVILIKDIKTLGKKGEVKEVNEGYYRNFLFPKGLAMIADNKNMNELNNKNRADQYKKEEAKKAAIILKEQLDDKVITFEIKVGANGKLFGSITEKDVIQEINKKFNTSFDKKKLVMDDHIKTLGYTNVKLKLYEGIEASIKVEVKVKK